MSSIINICDLPHELITAVGGHLLPTWRCRLFMCCKLWHIECMNIQKDFMKWCANIRVTLNIINSIKYNIMDDKHISITRRLIPDHSIAYIVRTNHFLESHCRYNVYYIVSRAIIYQRKHGHYISEFTHFHYGKISSQFIGSYYERYMGTYKPELFKIYCVTLLLSYHVHANDYSNLVNAFKFYFIPYVNSHCNRNII
jgi:hypothetical protein